MAVVETRAVKNLILSIQEVVDRSGRVRMNGAIASTRTKVAPAEVMRTFARTLHEAGFKVEVADNLGEKHVIAVFDNWVNVRGLSNKTLQNQKSIVKKFFGWMGKAGLCRFIESIDSRYFETHPRGFRVVNVAVESKSWRRQGIDVEALIRAAMLQDERHASMLLLGRAFGLRKKEMLMTKLWRADKGSHLALTGSVTKNGRPRDIEIEDGEFGEMQRRALDYAKSKCKRSESLMWEGKTFEQAERRYFHYNSMLGLTKENLGMTGHGLRAGYAEDLMLLSGVLPPTLGGIKEMSSEMTRKAAKFNASKMLGHNRESITHSYYGSDKRFAKAGDLLGYEFAEPMVLSSKSKAVLWVSEKPVESLVDAGQFELPGETAELAYITVQIVEGGREINRMSVDQFLEKHPVAIDGLNVRVGKLGFVVTLGE